jgi:selenide,water dikinase
MTTLNKIASEVIAAFSAAAVPLGTAAPGEPASANHTPIHSLTDVTGFGLIGHAREMALASNVSLRFRVSQTPLLEGALDCIRAGNIPGGLNNNRDFAECMVGYGGGIPEELKTILFDPQTAGGLLIAVAPEYSTNLIRDLRAAAVPAVEIGEVLAQTRPLIAITA